MARFVRFLLWTVLGLIGLVTLAFIVILGVRVWASQRQQAADRAWASSFESMDALVARYPAAPNSPAAVKLASLAGRLGLSLLPLDRPPDGTSGARREEEAPEAAKQFDPIRRFVSDQGTNTGGGVPVVVPAAVTDALSAMKADLDAIEAHLVGPEAIVWGIDLRRGLDGPGFSIWAYRDLATALLARSFEAARAGDGRAAQRSLDAFSTLFLALSDRPELTSQLIALAMDALRNGVLRQIAAAPGEWTAMPPGRNHTRALLRAIQADTLVFAMTARGSSNRSPFLELWLADASLRLQRLASALAVQNPCEMDVARFAGRAQADVPWWNPIGGAAMPGLVQVWATTAKTALDDELTRMVVAARARMRNPNAGNRLPASAASTTCAGLTWMVATQPNGDILIEARTNQPFDPAMMRRTSFRLRPVRSQ